MSSARTRYRDSICALRVFSSAAKLKSKYFLDGSSKDSRSFTILDYLTVFGSISSQREGSVRDLRPVVYVFPLRAIGNSPLVDHAAAIHLAANGTDSGRVNTSFSNIFLGLSFLPNGSETSCSSFISSLTSQTLKLSFFSPDFKNAYNPKSRQNPTSKSYVLLSIKFKTYKN